VLRQSLLQKAAGAAGGSRILAIIGEGETEEVVVSSALGAGLDGVNANYSGTNSPDGRHFQLQTIGLVVNRTRILLNGAPIVVLEAQIDTNPFDSRYDVRLDPVTGRVEMQQAHLVPFGSSGAVTTYYDPGPTNVGTGNPVITSTSLVDANAPQETWTVRCVSIVRDGYGNATSGEATFSVSGSTSGVIRDSDGNIIRWQSDGVVVSNGILSFSIVEGSTAFQPGDRFSVQVSSGVLNQNDSLEARYIPTLTLNDPQLFLDPNQLFAKHGDPSLTNTLSLAAQMAYENGAPAVLAVQGKPALPRRTNNLLITPDDPLTTAVEGASGSADIEDTIFPFPIGVSPDIDTQINIYVMNADGTEEQLLLTKNDFYNTSYSTVAATYSGFVTNATISQTYTVVQTPQIEQNGIDGYVISTNATDITFTSPTAAFSSDRLATGEGDIGKQLVFLDPTGLAGASGSFSTYDITDVGDGYGDTTIVSATRLTGPVLTGTEIFAGVVWQVQDPNDLGAQFAITDDVALNNLTVGKGLRVEIIDQRDADFFDNNWFEAYDVLESQNAQIIVPVPTQSISNIFQAGRSHVENMSSIEYNRERTVIVGAINGLVPDNLVGRELAAVENIGLLEGIQGDDPEEVLAGSIEDLADYSVTAAYGNSFRVVYMGPDQIIRNINGTNNVLSGYYMAPALGGFLAGQGNVAEPPTFKTLIGFSILRDRAYKTFTLDELADAGVLVVQPVAGGGRMLHGLTTSQSGAPESEEISIVAIRDQTSRALRNSLRPFIGIVETPTSIAAITDTVNDTLDALIAQGLLTGKGAVSVAKDSVEPRQVNVVVQVSPAAPINWIFIDATFSLT